ncbi:hypothetical protein V5O48_009310 [Marasmius crinis-equi]|uniref:Diacetyl reductase [(S)-acetoin forming] n=1 Tax=Marasmius crinis-equi TaxID=585013 RepID=A0ABR3FBM5_9AGAR
MALRATRRSLTLSRALSGSAAARKTALITGACRGIGRAIALRLASDGFDICIADLPSNAKPLESVAKEARALGREALAVSCDVTKMSQVEESVQKSVDALGPLSVMMANAGIVQIKQLVDTTEKEMRQIFEANVYGVLNSNIVAGKQFLKQGTGGKIINAASIASFRAMPPLSLYCSTKAAVRSLTQGFAQEYGPQNITVNAYAPGTIDTKMWEKIDAEIAKMKGVGVGETFRSKEAETALGRNGTPEDVSNLVSFLAGPNSDFITGQTMIVDGGMLFS